MRFQTRAFLISFVPLAILLAGSSWVMQRVVQTTVRDGIRSSLRQSQLAIGRIQAHSGLQNSRFLRVMGDNAALKAGLELLSDEVDGDGARRTVEDQLLELGEHMGFDLLLVTAPDGRPLAGVIRGPAQPGYQSGLLLPIGKALLPKVQPGVLVINGKPFQVAAIPMDANQDHLGILLVGEHLELSTFATPTVLLHNGAVVMSNLSGTSTAQIQTALSTCSGDTECRFQLHGSDWMSVSAPLLTGKDEYVIRSLQDVGATIKPIRAGLRHIFFLVASCSLMIILLCSFASSRSVVKPLAGLVAHMRRDAQTGLLTEFERSTSGIIEIRELSDSYNRATDSVQKAHRSLQGAYVEFVGSLASALDARDPYTAGHSRRVSDVACAIASEFKVSSSELERIRIGALLHDIGKIGVPDQVLQKTGRLTEDELHLIQQHPVVGRRILEGVRGFAPFLSAVELHHENWDGTGYPSRQIGEQVPLEARIIHVADAYDAMTTDRSYRKGMTHATAVRILAENAGTQFDPRIVNTFLSISHTFNIRQLELVPFDPLPDRSTAEVA